MTGKPIPEFAQSIMGQALAEFNGKNREEIVSKVESTAVGIDKSWMRQFNDLLDLKEKHLGLKGKR